MAIAEQTIVLATAVIGCERVLAVVDGCDRDSLSPQSHHVLEQVPEAAAWARSFSSGLRLSQRDFRAQTAPHILKYAVKSIALACAPDVEQRLVDLLAATIADCQALILTDASPKHCVAASSPQLPGTAGPRQRPPRADCAAFHVLPVLRPRHRHAPQRLRIPYPPRIGHSDRRTVHSWFHRPAPRRPPFPLRIHRILQEALHQKHPPSPQPRLTQDSHQRGHSPFCRPCGPGDPDDASRLRRQTWLMVCRCDAPALRHRSGR